MLAAGKLRFLSASDPDPYPDSIHVDLLEDVDEEGEDACFVGKAGRKRKGKTAIQKAIEKAKR